MDLIKNKQFIAKSVASYCMLLAPITLVAQTNSILMEACNEMQDKARRLECFKAAASPTPEPVKKSDAAIDAIKRVHGNMIASLTAGMNFNNYQLALIELSKGIEQFRLDTGSAYPLAIENFDEALISYGDAAKLWEASINFYSNRSFASTFTNSMPVALTGTQWIASKYSIQLKSDFLGLNPGIPVESARLQIWGVARDKFENGLRALP